METNSFVKEVAKLILEKQLIPFVGAGYSRLLGYPSWRDLLESVIETAKTKDEFLEKEKVDEIKKKIQDNLLQGAADIIANRVSSHKLLVANTIKDCERKKVGRDTRLNILKWGCKKIVTTNYDLVLESWDNTSVREYETLTYQSISNLFTRADSIQKNSILHLHGVQSEAKSIIFSTQDIYNSIWNNQYILKIIEALFVENRFLFIGYSIGDLHIEEILRKFSILKKQVDVFDYAILAGSMGDAIRWESDNNLRVLRLDKDNGFKTKDNLNLKDVLGRITDEYQILLESERNNSRFCDDISPIVNITRKLRVLASSHKISLPIGALLNLMIDKGLEAINSTNKTFTIHMVEGSQMRVIAHGGVNDSFRIQVNELRSIELGITGKVFRDNDLAYYSPDVKDCKYYFEANESTKSEYVIRLANNNGTFGVLNFESSIENDFNDEEKEILLCVADHISTALQNKRIYDLQEMVLNCIRILDRSNLSEQPNLERSLLETINEFIESINEHVKGKSGLSYCTWYFSSWSLLKYTYTSNEISVIASSNNDEINAVLEKQTILRLLRENIISEKPYFKVETFKQVFWNLKKLEGGNEHLFMYLSSENVIYLKNDVNLIDKLNTCFLMFSNYYKFLLQRKTEINRKREINLLEELIKLSDEIDPTQYFNSLARIICLKINSDWCFIYLRNNFKRRYDVDYIYELKSMHFRTTAVDRDEFSQSYYSPGEGLTGLTISKRGFIASEDCFADPRSAIFDRKVFEVRGLLKSKFLGHPILVPGMEKEPSFQDVFGTITIGRLTNSYDDLDREHLSSISIIIAKELQRRNLLSNNNNLKSYIKILNELPNSLIECKSENEILNLLSDFIPKYLSEQFYSVFKLNDEGILELEAPERYSQLRNVNDEKVIKPPSFRIGEGLTGRVIKDKSSIFEPDVQGKGMPECRNFWVGIIGVEDRYFIGVPIKCPINPDNFYGVLTLNGKKSELVNERRCESIDPVLYENFTMKVLESISNQITFALRSLKQFEKLSMPSKDLGGVRECTSQDSEAIEV
jgi:hypothetical protein